MEGIADDV